MNMTTVKIALGAALACTACARAEDTLLYFQIVDSPTVVTLTGSEVAWDDYVWSHNDTDYTINAARVVALQGGEPTPLLLGYSNEGTFNSSGLSMMPMDSSFLPTTLYAVVTDYGTGEWSFAIELGNYDNGLWTTLASSATLAYADLQNAGGQNGYTYLTTADALSLNGLQAWAPESYPVPEPSSGLLALIGAALLTLRRRRV